MYRHFVNDVVLSEPFQVMNTFLSYPPIISFYCFVFFHDIISAHCMPRQPKYTLEQWKEHQIALIPKIVKHAKKAHFPKTFVAEFQQQITQLITDRYFVIVKHYLCNF